MGRAAGAVTDERGPYLTQSRALELERKIAATEARLLQRLDDLGAELAGLRRAQVDTLRAQTKAMMDVLRDQLGAENPTRRAGGE